jgi:hypothetical protein
VEIAPPLLITNARIWTGDSHERADSALIVDGRFVFVGAAHEITPPASAETLDARGKLVVPGFVDAHAHLLNTGFAMRSIDLKGAPTVNEALLRVRERAAQATGNTWLRGSGWDQHLWGGVFPTRGQLDAVTGPRPAALAHTSGHCLWVNSAALRAAGITASTVSPAGGAIDLADDGEPSGILRDNAARLAEAVIPHPTPAERLLAMRETVAHAHALGITAAHAMDAGRGEYQALLALRAAGELTLRVRAYMTATRLNEWFDRGLQTGDGDEWLRIGGVKFFADGALGPQTAWMHEPYEGSVDVGFPLQPVDELEQAVRRCLEGGLAPAVHAIGDRANSEVLDLFERLAGVAPRLPRRIEHAQLLRPDDVPRFGALGIVASMQPIHATQDFAKVDRHWGKRGRHAYAFASLTRAGACIAFGSDTPVETMDPLAGLHAAVTRTTAGGEPRGGWYPGERLHVTAALSMYTSGAAAATGERSPAGLRAGAPGDCVVLSEDIVEEAGRLAYARAESTVAGGRVVHQAPGAG